MERNTRQREAIRDAIAQAERPLLPQEVLDAAQQQAPGLGIATVYRNLKALLAEGELQSVKLPGENARFELAGHQHHHHFQCKQCQRVFDVHACPGDLSKLAPQGFTVEDHDLTQYRSLKVFPRVSPSISAQAFHRQQGRAKPMKPSTWYTKLTVLRPDAVRALQGLRAGCSALSSEAGHDTRSSAPRLTVEPRSAPI